MPGSTAPARFHRHGTVIGDGGAGEVGPSALRWRAARGDDRVEVKVMTGRSVGIVGLIAAALVLAMGGCGGGSAGPGSSPAGTASSASAGIKVGRVVAG